MICAPSVNPANALVSNVAHFAINIVLVNVTLRTIFVNFAILRNALMVLVDRFVKSVQLQVVMASAELKLQFVSFVALTNALIWRVKKLALFAASLIAMSAKMK